MNQGVKCTEFDFCRISSSLGSVAPISHLIELACLSEFCSTGFYRWKLFHISGPYYILRARLRCTPVDFRAILDQNSSIWVSLAFCWFQFLLFLRLELQD